MGSICAREVTGVKNLAYKLIRRIFLIGIIGATTFPLRAREYFITPDGETVYYSSPPRILVYKPEAAPEKPYTIFVPHGNRPELVSEPTGIFIDRHNRIYVSDAGKGIIKVYGVRGRFLRRIGGAIKTPNALHRPGALAITPFGDVFVADLDTRRVFSFDCAGKLLGPLHKPRAEDKGIDFPAAIAAAPDGSIFISDSPKSRISRYSFQGRYKTSWGKFGRGAGELNRPRGLALGEGGEVFIADTDNHRVQVFAQSGKFLRRFGEKGKGRGQFMFPYAIAASFEGRIAVADRGGLRIQFFTPFGKYLGGINFDKGTAGAPDVRIDALDFDSIGALYVVDGQGRRVLKFFPHSESVITAPETYY